MQAEWFFLEFSKIILSSPFGSTLGELSVFFPLSGGLSRHTRGLDSAGFRCSRPILRINRHSKEGGRTVVQQTADTSLGLLSRVQSGDSAAWDEFASRCYDVIGNWCRWQKLSQPDADDVVQNSMMVVLRKIGDFHHSGRGSMRGWLKAIAWRCWCDAVTRTNRSQYHELRRRYEIAVDEIASLELQYERLRQAALLQRAMLLVKQRVRSSTWTVFYRTAWLNESSAAVSADLNIPAYVVYSAKARVQKLIEQEVSRLEAEEGSVEPSRLLQSSAEASQHDG